MPRPTELTKRLLSPGPLALLAVLVGLLSGCSGKPELMPTPNLYAWGNFDPFEGVPAELQNNRAEVLYYTDRLPETDSAESPEYGYGRSRSASFGVSELVIGEDVSWEELVKASRVRNRDVDLGLTVTGTRELGRFDPTPRKVIEAVDAVARMQGNLQETPSAQQLAAEESFRKELSRRLAQTPSKEVYIFIHGYANNFDDSVRTIGQLWHFFGRRGVPIAYSWPAGSPGAFSYMYDRESSEFTVFHLKHMLRLVASCPDVERVNIISHSRGTDVAASAIRELHIECRGAKIRTRDALKLGVLVLAAPDLDFDVVIQRLATERIGQVAEQTVIYVCEEDRALGISNWLFSGMNRLGKLRSTMFSPEEMDTMRRNQVAQFIDARISDTGAFGHDYFHSNPAVSSDLILMMRYRLPPGAENARPLRITENGFWAIDDDYPGRPRDMKQQTADK